MSRPLSAAEKTWRANEWLWWRTSAAAFRDEHRRAVQAPVDELLREVIAVLAEAMGESRSAPGAPAHRATPRKAA